MALIFRKKRRDLTSFLEEQNKKQKELYLIKGEDHSFTRILGGSSSFFRNAFSFLSGKGWGDNQHLRESVEETLISLDFGPFLAEKIAGRIASEIPRSGEDDPDRIRFLIKKILLETYGRFDNFDRNFIRPGITNIFLITGANGVGKTTTLAKLVYRFKSMGHKTLIVAADTFRAGASEQLGKWARKLGSDIILPTRAYEDPSSLIYRALSESKDKKYDVIICDTSGKQHNQQNLMNELNKIYRTIRKFDCSAPHESLLVLDSTLGQGSFLQAQSFLDKSGITGIVLTKMDRLHRGGIIFAIREKFKLPVKFIGTGESKEDLREFDLEEILNCWLSAVNF